MNRPSWVGPLFETLTNTIAVSPTGAGATLFAAAARVPAVCAVAILLVRVGSVMLTHTSRPCARIRPRLAERPCQDGTD
jgi:hypothetical protein